MITVSPGDKQGITCRYFGVSRESFYTWRRAYEQDGEEGLSTPHK
ncbi:helix-turn-helix domain-containing protein [Piscirickettsia salmonis]|nr:helix-turn-helix domain-containing protein [Piscirickettsia salmonis]QNR81648.1 helix-turn-helix domain-containing protein [Piscirickettsia salmonis]